MAGQTIYEFLEVPATCTAEELKTAWRKKAKVLHPDVNGGDARKTALFVEAKALYEGALKWKETHDCGRTKPVRYVNEELRKAYQDLEQDLADLNRQMNDFVARQQAQQQQHRPGHIFRWW